jgi:hypothetical protein
MNGGMEIWECTRICLAPNPEIEPPRVFRRLFSLSQAGAIVKSGVCHDQATLELCSNLVYSAD